ncbi:MAG: glycosyltransferase family 4 protein [Desulfobacterales bacterium]
MHILHIETGRNLYGGALQVLYLLRGLRERGVENILVCSTGSDISRAAAPYADVRTMPMKGELDVSFGLRLIRFIKNSRPDLIHVHSRRGADIWGAFAARSRHVPAVITRRVDNPEPALLARMKYRCYERIVVISEGIRRVLLSEGVPADKIVCVPSAVDARRFAVPCDRQWFLREFGLLPTHRTIAMIAQFIPRKGHRVLIDAAPQILAGCPAARFILFGKGPLEKEIQRLCTRKRIADKVIFGGFRDDLERILPCLDLVVHPAEMEGLGVSLLQAAAAGVPIVASRVGGIPEIVHDGVNGYLVEAGDVCGMTARMTGILLNPEHAGRLGSAGQELVRYRFSIDAMVSGNLAVYREGLSKRKPGRDDSSAART